MSTSESLTAQPITNLITTNVQASDNVAHYTPPPISTLLPTVYIVGFAPSWSATPWDDPEAERWGMNALHRIAADKPWSRWYQLHDIDTHHQADKDEHVAWLRDSGLPIYMWPEHIERYGHLIPNAVPYPKVEVLEYFGPFGRYFTNTVSWMVAHAITEKRRKIGVFGVDMAQDSEYGNQRPSCEYFLGWAQGEGIEIEIPQNSDLLKAPFLYGAEDGSILRRKFDFRLKELQERRQEMERQMQQLQGQLNQASQAHQQLLGAIEDTQYWLRAWSTPTNDGKEPHGS